MSTYNELLKDPRWKHVRNIILKRDEYKCTCCGSNKKLQIHHILYDDFEPWNTDYKYLITLCRQCHYKLHKNSISYNLNEDYNLFLNKVHMQFDWISLSSPKERREKLKELMPLKHNYRPYSEWSDTEKEEYERQCKD